MYQHSEIEVIESETAPMVKTQLPVPPKSETRWFVYCAGFGLMTAVIVVFVISVVILMRMHGQLQSLESVNLSSLDLIQNWANSETWNIVQYDYGQSQLSYDSSDNAIKVLYPKGSWAPSAGETDGYGGFNFYASPKVFPAKEVCFTYEVKFDKSFNWVKGGKLPGMWIGDIGASGGNHDVNGYSYRFAWHTKGSAQAYIYVPDQQSPDFEKQQGYVSNDIYGDTLWRGLYTFEREVWYNIKLHIKLNTFHDNDPNEDGIIGLSVGNKTMSFDKVIWTDSKDHNVNGLMMDTFFGGSDVTWASLKTTYSYFRNFFVSKGIC